VWEENSLEGGILGTPGRKEMEGEGERGGGVWGEWDSHHPAESNNKSEVNPLPGRKLSLKPDEATAVQRQNDTQTREQLLIPHGKMRTERSDPGGRPLGFV
jgi:hypothetical protein